MSQTQPIFEVYSWRSLISVPIRKLLQELKKDKPLNSMLWKDSRDNMDLIQIQIKL